MERTAPFEAVYAIRFATPVNATEEAQLMMVPRVSRRCGMANREQKEELLHCLFAISAADESISALEEATVAQIAKELGLSHRDQVEIRSHYRDKRAVFQKNES